MAASDDIFAPGFVERPYWWDAAPPEDARDQPLPEETDVAIVGSGYCGLSAALELARNGMRATVLEAGPLGQGPARARAGWCRAGRSS